MLLTVCLHDSDVIPAVLSQGLIQSVFELDDGSGVVVTVGKYVTPNHKDINGNGIEPDYRNLPGDNLILALTNAVMTLFNLKNLLYAAWSDVKHRLSQCNMLQQG